MTQHTPGPWYVDEDPRDGMEWNRHICDSGDNRICFMAHSNGRAPERDEANARLIAAAPDLLEALKHLYALVQGECPRLLEDNHHDTMVRAAFAKAEGRT